MRAVGLHEDVIAVTSRVYATGCVLVRNGGEAFCIDSPVFPDELEILPAMAAQAGFNVVGVLATHADWDHLLGGYAFPEAPLGAARASAARLINEPGAAQRELRDFDEEFYVSRPGPLSLPGAQRLAVPGYVDIGAATLELQPADGHTVDGMAIWIPWASVLVAGDYLSPVEIPMISRGGRCRVPGDVEAARAAGRAGRARRAGPRRADRRHARAGDPARGPRLPGGAARAGRALPLARRTKAQRAIHAKNLTRR